MYRGTGFGAGEFEAKFVVGEGGITVGAVGRVLTFDGGDTAHTLGGLEALGGAFAEGVGDGGGVVGVVGHGGCFHTAGGSLEMAWHWSS